MVVRIKNNSDVQVDVYVDRIPVHTLKSGDIVDSNRIPHSLLGLRLETQEVCKKAIFIEFKNSDKKENINHIFGEIGHPEIT